MSDNSAAIKTIGALVLLLIGLGAAYIFSYNPIPKIAPVTPGATTKPVEAVACDSENPDEVTRCCQDWATNNEITTAECLGNWSWSKLGGCTFTCTEE